MDEVCNVKDCPMYGYFINMSNHPITLENKEKERETKTIEDVITNMYIAVVILANNMRMRSLCSSCCHFEKQDISKILIKEEAKKVLSEE